MRANLGELFLASAIVLLLTCPRAWSAAAVVQRKPILPLDQLADSHFSNLSECEKTLLRTASLGEIAFCGPEHSPVDQVPNQGTALRQKYDVRANLIRWLCVYPAATKLVDPRGPRIHAARVVGRLDLSFITVPFPLLFENSRFIEDVSLVGSQLVSLSFAGSHTRKILADGVTVRDGLFLNGGFSADGEVSLTSANIIGNLDAENGHFKNVGKVALSAEHLKGAIVSLNNGFSAEGEVRLRGANIAGDLVADGGNFKNPDKFALNADGLKAANVFLTEGFSAEGEVRFPRANITGDLDAAGAHITNLDGVALNIDGLKAFYVLLGDGFSAEGEVSLVAANLSGYLNASNGRFKNPGNLALAADELTTSGYFVLDSSSVDGKVTLRGANVKGPLFLRNLRSAVKRPQFLPDLWSEGDGHLALDLEQATVGSLYDDPESWPEPGNLNLNGFVYTSIGEGPTDSNDRLRWLRLQQAQDTHSNAFAPQPYEQLAKVLREAGDDAGAKSVLIAMENARWWYRESGRGRVWNFILWLTIGYGYDTWRALYSVAFFVIMGTFVFFWGYKAGAITQTDKDKPEHYRPFNSLIYSVETFLPLVDLQQAEHWAPNPEFNQVCPPVPIGPFKPLSMYKLPFRFSPALGRRLRWYLWVHIVAGWFFTAVLVAAFTGLVQKN
jgi:hypothetical protein